MTEKCGACRSTNWSVIGNGIYQCNACSNYILKSGKVLRCPTCYAGAVEFNPKGPYCQCNACDNLLKRDPKAPEGFSLVSPADRAQYYRGLSK